MPSIQRLPSHVVNKIAAGEVIERPASVVKELVENALDAGATRIDVSVEKGGLELLRVVDNGSGISAEELPLAVAPHATSKIRSAEDLFRVGTLGFRGEALASIASVSQFTLRSRPRGQASGAELVLHGGAPASLAAVDSLAADESKLFADMALAETNGRTGTNTATESRATVESADNDLAEAVTPCGCAEGTTVEVGNLFFNTPVRRKFLKTTQTELGHISETIVRLALAHPQVHFTLRHNGREVHDLPATVDWRERIAHFFGQELAAGLIAIQRDEPSTPTGPGCRLFGYVGNPTHSRPNNKSQYFFLNGRYIRDRSLQHALSEAYRGLLLTGRFPIAFLCFEVAPDAVDVNVHPTKLEVRFQDGGRLYSLLLGTLRAKFLATDLTAQWKSPPRKSTPLDPLSLESPADAAGAASNETERDSAHDPQQAGEVRQELIAWAKGQLAAWELDDAPQLRNDALPTSGVAATLPDQGANGIAHGQPSFIGPRQFPASPAAGPLSGSPRAELKLHSLRDTPPTSRDVASMKQEPSGNGAPAEPSVSAMGESHGAATPPWNRSSTTDSPEPPVVAQRGALQVHNRYLIAETSDGVLVIDQHALHERVLYEQLRARVLSGALECQQLLVPQPVDLAPAEAAAVLDQRELLGQLGIRVEAFGGDTVLVGSYPAMLGSVNLVEMLRSVVDRLTSGGKLPDRRDLLDELLHMMSCKAAVKAGDPLTPAEIEALLEQRHLADDAHHCPHGRPTALVLTRAELDRQFLRT